MSKKNHTLPTIITILCLVIAGALLSYHFAPSSPTRTSHTDHNTPNKVPPNTTPPAQITEESTPSMQEESEHETSSFIDAFTSVVVVVVVVVVLPVGLVYFLIATTPIGQAIKGILGLSS